MFSVTSIEPSFETMIVDSKFSMRSSREEYPVARAQKTKTTAVRHSHRILLERKAFIADATRRSGCGRAEAHLGGFALGGGGHFKEFEVLEVGLVGIHF